MPIKTDLCAFSEIRIYPGHGVRYVTRNGQLVTLSGSKVTSLFLQKKKPAKLYWTLACRRRLKKKQSEEAAVKRRARRVVKITRGFVGAEKIDEIKKKNIAARPAAGVEVKKSKSGAVLQAAVEEAKKAKKAAIAAKKAAAGGSKGGAPKAATKHAGKGR